MFVNVGRFTFRPMERDERQGLLGRIEKDVRPVAADSSGFGGMYCATPSDDELLMVWLWDTEADWESALARLGPALQEYVIPNLAKPPDRVGGEVAIAVDLRFSTQFVTSVRDYPPGPTVPAEVRAS